MDKNCLSFSKTELIDIVVSDFNVLKSFASKLTKKELCNIITKGKTSKSSSRSKSRSRTKKRVSFNRVKKYKKITPEKDSSSSSSSSDSSDSSDEDTPLNKRACGVRKSKKHPDAYSKSELISLAVKQGIKKSVATKMKIMDLCIKLKLIDDKDESSSSSSSDSEKEDKKDKKDDSSSSDSSSSSSSEEEEKRDEKDRPCGVRKSKKNPYAYSKAELVELVAKKGLFTKIVAKKMKVNDLCEALGFTNKGEIKEKEELTDLTFESKKCLKYTIQQLQRLAETLDIKDVENKTKKELCNIIISTIKENIRHLYNECLKFKTEDVKKFALSKDLSIKGSKKQICDRIFKDEKSRIGIEDEDLTEEENGDASSHNEGDLTDEDKKLKQDAMYITFCKKYLKAKSKDERDMIVDQYKKDISNEFINMFVKLPGKDKEEFLEEYLKPKNISKSPLKFINEFIKKKFSVEEKKDEEELACITRSKLKLQKHQKKVVKHMLKNRGLIAIHPVGSGKTLTLVTCCICVLNKFPEMEVLIIVPTSLTDNIKKEFAAYGFQWDNPRISIVTTTKFANNVQKNPEFCKNKFLIIDEGHNLKTQVKRDKSGTIKFGKKSESIIECCKRAAKVLILTATPVMNRSNEIINLIGMVDGETPITPNAFDRYIMTDDKAFEKYFKCKISMLDFKKDESYPSSEDHKIEFVMSENYYAKYKDVEEEISNDFNTPLFGGSNNLSVFFNGIRRGANNLEEENGPKINWTINKIIEENKKNKRNKTLVYSSFLDAGSQLVIKRLNKLKIPYVKVDGSMSKNARKQSVIDYNSGKVSVLIISKSGSEGLDLKGTRHIILLEPNWNSNNEEQTIGRGVRKNSHSHLPEDERHVDIWRLIMVKPTDKMEEGEMISVDEFLVEMGMKKKVEIDSFMERLKKYSIENNEC